MAQVGGSAFLRANGVAYSTDGKFECKINQNSRSAVVASDGTVHYTETAVASTVSGSLIAVPGLNVAAIQEMENVTLLIELKNGRQCLLANSFQSGELSESTESGLVSFEFTGAGRWL